MKLFQEGTFFIGANYWASHAGLNMWSEWDAETVERDFRILADNRIRVLRIFPLWSDFQPLRMHLGGSGRPMEVRLGEKPLTEGRYGTAGVSDVMMDRLDVVCGLAEKYGIRLIIGLVTGWMSGRLFVPEMLQNRNILTDPLALQWEVRYVRCLTRHLKELPAVAAWDLGNECNCMGEIDTPEQAYVWSALIASVIRSEDTAHPILSGMHSLSPDGNWRMQDQGELLDILCTHPYPLFTPWCDTDPMNRMKSALHASGESRFYSDIGGKPCFAEELGVLGPMVISEEFAADYIRTALFQLMADDCRGLMWWCAFEQSHLTGTPYDWNAVERELGLFHADGSEKPVLREMRQFDEWHSALPFDRLPPKITDAVCILTHGQDAWRAAYGAYIAAKQAHMDIRFTWADQPLPDAQTYLLPGLEGDHAMSSEFSGKLYEKVRNGAVLYMSMDGAILSPFADIAGVHVLTRGRRHQKSEAECGKDIIRLERDVVLEIGVDDAEILHRAKDGSVVTCRHACGRGSVITTFYPAEKYLASEAGAVDGAEPTNSWMLYRSAGLRSAGHAADLDNALMTLTEHPVHKKERYLVVVNCEPHAQSAKLTLRPGWKTERMLCYSDSASLEGNTLTVKPNSGVILKIGKAE